MSSAEQHAEFLDEATAEEIILGIMLPWQEAWGLPHTISPVERMNLHREGHHHNVIKMSISLCRLLDMELNWWLMRQLTSHGVWASISSSNSKKPFEPKLRTSGAKWGMAEGRKQAVCNRLAPWVTASISG